MAQRPSSRPSGGDSSRGNWRNPGRKAPVKRETPLYGRGQTSNSGLWWKRVLSLLLVFVLVLVFIAVIRWIPRSTPLVVMTVTNYAAPAPPNSWAQEDAQSLSAAWSSKGTWQDYWNNVRVVAPEESTPTAETFLQTALKLLEEHPAGGPQKNVRVLYLSAHGVVNGAGEPCLLLANPRSDQATQIWPNDNAELPLVSLPELIARLRESAKQSAGSKYVLLLDANRIASNWRLGVLENDFATRLAEHMNATTTPGDNSVVIINSASPGEVAQAYPEYGASGFGMCARAGLLGAADSDNDRKVELLELHDYLLKNVDVLAQQGRYRTQQPQLLPSKVEDFAVAYAQDRDSDPLAGKSEATAEDRRERWQTTYDLWEQHAKLTHYHDDLTNTADQSELRLPSLVALEQGLLQLDQLADAGAAYNADFQALAAALQRLSGELLNQQEATKALPRTLAAAPAASGAGAGSPAPPTPEYDWLRAMLAGGEEGKKALENWQTLPLARQQYFVFHWLASEPEPSFDDGLKWLTAPASPKALAIEPPGIRTIRSFRSGGALPVALRGNRSLLQKVLQLRDETDRFASGDGDLRAQYVAVPYVVAADAARRDSEDRLFTGDVAGVEAALASATMAYRGDIHDSRNIALWYGLRDQLWQELPLYAEWSLTLQRESSGQAAKQTEADEMVERVRRAIELNTRLTQGLEWLTEAVRGVSPATEVGALTKQINELGAALQVEHRTLRREFQDAVDRCQDGAADRANLAEIVRVLRVPLSGYNRKALRTRYLDILTKLRAPTLSKDVEEQLSAATASDLIRPANFAEIAKQGQHPGELLWQASERFPVAISGLKLAGLSTTIEPAKAQPYATQLPLVKVASQVQQIRKVEATAPRAALSGADQESRLVLPFVTLPPTFSEPENGLDHPQKKLYECDLHQHLVFQADRTLDDFWGAADAPAGAGNLGDYFALVAADYLQEAGRLYSNQSEPLRAAQQKLALRKEGAQQLLYEIARATITGKPIEGTSTFDRTISWPDSDQAGKVNGLPPGQAALYTMTNTGTRGSILLRASSDADFQPEIKQSIVASGEPGTILPAKLDFQFSNQAGEDSAFDLVFYYRSHGERQLVNVGKLAPGPLVVWNRPEIKTPTVVVQKEATPDANPGSVAIVLDCSRSMGEPFAGGVDRMTVALRTLRELTDELQRNGQNDFTIWLFGHRRFAPTGSKEEIDKYKLGRNHYSTPFNPAFEPDNPAIHYHNDVQKVWPNDKGPSLTTLLSPEAKYVLPWGRTPLYAAMHRVITEDLGKRDKSVPRRMIVISDGDNVVRIEPEDTAITYKPVWNYKANEDKSARDVRDALLEDCKRDFAEHIELHVVDLTNGSATAIKKDEVVKAVQGTFHAAGNLDDLKRILREAAGLYKYEIHNDTRQQPFKEDIPLGTLTDIQNYNDQKFSVRLAGRRDSNSARFQLSGSEGLVYNIQYEGGQPRILPWRGNIEKSAAQIVLNPVRHGSDDDFFPKSFQTVLAVPQRAGASDVRFRIAVLNQQAERFSPRPKAAWVEIEPGNTVEGAWMPAAEKYIFTDLALEDGQPVPVLQQTARAWPRAAKEARVQVWFSLQEWPSAFSKQLRKLRVSSADEEENFEIKAPGLPAGLRCSVQITSRPEGGSLVIVTQTSDSPTPLAVRIKMSRPPDTIRRQYYLPPHAGRVQHVFEYRNVGQDELLDDFLDFQTLEQLTPIAAHLETPVVIRVPEN